MEIEKILETIEDNNEAIWHRWKYTNFEITKEDEGLWLNIPTSFVKPSYRHKMKIMALFDAREVIFVDEDKDNRFWAILIT